MASKTRITFLALAGALTLTLATGQASAFSEFDYVDIDEVKVELGRGQGVSGEFDLTAANAEGDDFSDVLLGPNLADRVGFDPATQSLASARISFLLFDSMDLARDVAVIEIGGDVLTRDLSIPLFFTVHLERIDVDVDVLAQLDATGVLDWTITADGTVRRNDFKVAFARLEAVRGGPPTAMPEPHAAALFGFGFLVVARSIRRARP